MTTDFNKGDEMKTTELQAVKWVVCAGVLIVAMICTASVIRIEYTTDADVDKARIKEEKKLERTEERWGTMPWNRKKESANATQETS